MNSSHNLSAMTLAIFIASLAFTAGANKYIAKNPVDPKCPEVQQKMDSQQDAWTYNPDWVVNKIVGYVQGSPVYVSSPYCQTVVRYRGKTVASSPLNMGYERMQNDTTCVNFILLGDTVPVSLKQQNAISEIARILEPAAGCTRESYVYAFENKETGQIIRYAETADIPVDSRLKKIMIDYLVESSYIKESHPNKKIDSFYNLVDAAREIYVKKAPELKPIDPLVSFKKTNGIIASDYCRILMENDVYVTFERYHFNNFADFNAYSTVESVNTSTGKKITIDDIFINPGDIQLKQLFNKSLNESPWIKFNMKYIDSVGFGDELESELFLLRYMCNKGIDTMTVSDDELLAEFNLPDNVAIVPKGISFNLLQDDFPFDDVCGDFQMIIPFSEVKKYIKPAVLKAMGISI